MADHPEAVVVDIGSSTARFGFAGDSSPCRLPSAVGKLLAEGDAAARALFGAAELSVHRESLQVLPTVSRGAVSDWASLGQLWRHGAEGGEAPALGSRRSLKRAALLPCRFFLGFCMFS